MSSNTSNGHGRFASLIPIPIPAPVPPSNARMGACGRSQQGPLCSPGRTLPPPITNGSYTSSKIFFQRSAQDRAFLGRNSPVIPIPFALDGKLSAVEVPTFGTARQRELVKVNIIPNAAEGMNVQTEANPVSRMFPSFESRSPLSGPKKKEPFIVGYIRTHSNPHGVHSLSSPQADSTGKVNGFLPVLITVVLVLVLGATSHETKVFVR